MSTPAFIRALRKKVGTSMLQVPTVATLTVDASNRILLVRNRGMSEWTTPGGIVEPYELPSDAAVRETWEESGVYVSLERVLGIFGGVECARTYPNGDQISWVVTVFAARPVHGTPRPDNEETEEARYFSRSELETLPCRPHLRMVLEAEGTGTSQTVFRPSLWEPNADPSLVPR